MAVRHYEYMLGRTLKTMYCDLLTGADACLQLKCQVNSNVTLNNCTIKQSTGPIKQSTGPIKQSTGQRRSTYIGPKKLFFAYCEI